MIDLVLKYFPDLTRAQIDSFAKLGDLYSDWNSRINVISRKDMDNFYLHHVLHSLAIGKKYYLGNNSSVLDVGTGGGFPGIPLAILFPESDFTLVDSIEKKIKVVDAVREALSLKNVRTVRTRIEDHHSKYNYIVSRAVTDFSVFVKWTTKNLYKGTTCTPPCGIIYLKGGDLEKELEPFVSKAVISDIKDIFPEPFFETKHIVYLPASFFQKKTLSDS